MLYKYIEQVPCGSATQIGIILRISQRNTKARINRSFHHNCTNTAFYAGLLVEKQNTFSGRNPPQKLTVPMP